jgi:DnaJ-class molecular chaperone
VRPFFGTKAKVDLKLYDTMELDQSSPQEEIKKQFFKLAKQYHPDVNKEKDA